MIPRWTEADGNRRKKRGDVAGSSRCPALVPIVPKTVVTYEIGALKVTIFLLHQSLPSQAGPNFLNSLKAEFAAAVAGEAVGVKERRAWPL